jgi:hypothetical protein
LRSRHKRAVSPVVAETILIAVAISTGLGVWGFTQSSVGARLQAQGEQTAADMNAVRERFVIVNLSVTAINATHGDYSLFVYNNGLVPTEIVGLFAGSGSSFTNASITSSSFLPPGQIVRVDFVFTYTPGEVLFVRAVGQHGSSETYFEEV